MRRILIMSAATAAALIGLAAAAGPAQAQKQGRYCLSQHNVGPNTNCSFQTMAACNAAKTGNNDTCTPNPHRTTGERINR